MGSVFDAAGGDAGLLRLAEAWHARVLADEVVAHAFRQGFNPDHTRRLAAYRGEALGGPASYSNTYGDETSVARLLSLLGAAAPDILRAWFARLSEGGRVVDDLQRRPVGYLGRAGDRSAWSALAHRLRGRRSRLKRVGHKTVQSRVNVVTRPFAGS